MVESLLAELAQREIVLVSDGGRLRYYPRGRMTADLASRLKEHKAEVLEILAEPWPETVEPDLEPCEVCGGLELWETLPGRWRCIKCDPPKTARRLLKRAERIRRRMV